MLYCQIGLASDQPHGTAGVPAACEARVQQQRAIGQRDHGADVLAEIGERKGGIGQDGGIVAGHLQGPATALHSLAPILFRIVGPTVDIAHNMADRRPGDGRPEIGVALDSPIEQVQHLRKPPRRRQHQCIGAQIQVVGGQVVGRAPRRALDLRHLQCRLDHTGDAQRHLVLQVEHIFEQTVEPIGPISCAVIRMRPPALGTDPSST